MTSVFESRKRKKKVNPFVAYFVPFGIKQISEIGMLAAAIVCVVGFFTVDVVLLVGISIMLAATLLGVFRGLSSVLKHKNERRNRAFSDGLYLAILMGVLAIIAIVALIVYIV